MKNRLYIVLFAVAISFPVAAQFIHPGCLHTQVDFDRINTQLAASDHPRIALAWNSFNDNWLLTNSGSWIDAISGDAIIRDSGGNFAHSERDFGMCYIKALYWAMKHNSSNAAERLKAETLANQAVTLLNKYTKKIKTIGGDSNFALVGCFQGWQVANAGELLRDYAGWPAEEQTRYKKWIYDVWYTAIQDFLFRQNGTCPSHYQSNWNTGNTCSLQAIGIYLDDPAIYNEAMYYLKQSDQNCSIADDMLGTGFGYLVNKWDTEKINAQLAANGINTRYESPLGFLYQNQESTRDQPHCQGALGCQLQSLEQAWNQGDNVYGWNNQAMAGGVEYTAGFNGADDNDSTFMRNYPNVAWSGCDAYQPSISYSGRGGKDPLYQMAVNHYANRMGLKMPYAKKAHQKICDSFSWGVEWGAGVNTRFSFSDLCGFGDLMFNQDSATVHPTVLRGKIKMVSGFSISNKMGQYKYSEEWTRALVSGDTLFTNELSNIVAESVIRLSPTIMDGSTDSGQWTWDDDSTCTTRERDVKLLKSRIIRARYKNATGAVSTQMFSLHVEGEGWTGVAKPYYVSDYTTYFDSAIYVKKYASVTLGLSYRQMSSVRGWKWEKKTLTGTTWNALSSTVPTLDLTNISTGAYYRVTMTNHAGSVIAQEFKVDVAEVDPYIALNAAPAVSTTSLSTPKGSKVKIYASPNSLLGKSVDATRIYKWVVGGDTVKIDTLTYHLDSYGTKVADLSDTLSIASLDSCLECTMVFLRVSSSGIVANTTYHFKVPVYNTNDLIPGSEEYFYVIDPISGRYLNNTDATFTDYDGANDIAFQWKFRKLASTYGSRYYISSITNSSKHLSDVGKLTTTTDYSKYSFNLLHKCSDEQLYGIQQSASSTGKALTIDQSLFEMGVSTVDLTLSGFPFKIVSVDSIKGDTLTVLTSPKVQNESILLTWAQHDKLLVVNVLEEGTLWMYNLDGLLLRRETLNEGLHTLNCTDSRGLVICHYVTISGKLKTFKLLL